MIPFPVSYDAFPAITEPFFFVKVQLIEHTLIALLDPPLASDVPMVARLLSFDQRRQQCEN